MAFRFQRRIRIAPGIRINLSKRGVGLSAGPRGASVSVGSRGVYGNLGLPGTGLSYREKLNKKHTKQFPGNRTRKDGRSSIDVKIDDDGQVRLFFATGELLDTRQVAAARKQAGDTIRAIMAQVCDSRNELLESITCFHHSIPEPTTTPEYNTSSFLIAEPTPSLLARSWALVFPQYRRKLDREYESWQAAKADHDKVQQERKSLEEIDVFSDIDAMQKVLEIYLGEIDWPTEPVIDFDLGENNKTLALDIQFPDEDQTPDKVWSIPGKQYRLTAKKVTPTRRRQIYRDYVHSIMMRVTGEIFARLPTVDHVLISGYREKVNPSSGHAEDEYIISAIINRDRWESMDFAQLRRIEPTEVFTAHLLRRSMTVTGVFSQISPFSTGDLEQSSDTSGLTKDEQG